jgi:hypothetical protein
MAITINWGTQVISIPQSDLTNLGGGRFELNIDWFRLQLKALEESEDGIMFPDTHRHNTEVTLSGTTYARSVEIINGYTVEFEPTMSPYTVVCVGANHNIGDVKTVNHVSLIIGNAAGLIVNTVGSGVLPSDVTDIANAAADKVWQEILSDHSSISGSTAEALDRAKKALAALMGLL